MQDVAKSQKRVMAEEKTLVVPKEESDNRRSTKTQGGSRQLACAGGRLELRSAVKCDICGLASNCEDITEKSEFRLFACAELHLFKYAC